MGPENISEVALAFDAAAADYDSDFGANPIGRWMRERVWETCLEVFKAGDIVLDLGAGTGIDALFLARHDVSVHAVDVSPKMIERLSGKLAGDDDTLRVTYGVLGMESLGQLSESRYDGALSNFGALNCLQDLSTVAQSLSSVLKPGASFVACTMGKFCLIETLVFLRRGKMRQAFRRTGLDARAAEVADQTIRVYYHSPGKLVSFFSPFFDLEGVYALGVCLPPSWSPGLVARKKAIFASLKTIDRRVGALPLFRSMGDHFVVQLRRKRRL